MPLDYRGMMPEIPAHQGRRRFSVDSEENRRQFWPTAPEEKPGPNPPDMEGEPGVEAVADVDNPSAFESVLKTLGLGGFGVRNILKGNIEGTGRNLVDALTSPVRAVLPGDQSNWELSREEDLPEFSDVIGGMEPGWGKTAVDLVGGIATDPLSFVGVGEFSNAAKAAGAASKALKLAHASKDAVRVAEATKAAQAANATLKASRAAGETRKTLGVGFPFMTPAAEIPGARAGLDAAGATIKAVTPPIVQQGVAKAGQFLGPKIAAAGHSLRKTFAAVKPTEEIAENVAGAEALGTGVRTPGMEKPIAINRAFSRDIQEKAHLILEDIIHDPSLPAGQQFKTLDVSPGLSNFGDRAQQLAVVDSRLGRTAWDDATKAQVREAAMANSDFYANQYRQATAGGVMKRPDVFMQGERVIPTEHVRGLYGEENALAQQNAAKLQKQLEINAKRASRQEAKIQELKPLHEQAASAAYAAGTKADELLTDLPDLIQQKKNYDALDLKLANWEGAANTLGSLSEGTGMRSAKLEQKILDNRYAIKQAKEAATALRVAREGGADPAVLAHLREAASGATAATKESLLQLIDIAKEGKLGELIDAHQTWTGLKSESNTAAKAIREAKQAGLDLEQVKALKADLALKKAAAEGASRKLQSLVPRLSEMSGVDSKVMGRLANKEGKIREIRQLMNQLDDADFGKIGSLSKRGYTARGAEAASTTAAERAFTRLQRAEGNLTKQQEMRPFLEGVLKDVKDRPKFMDWATQRGYQHGPLPESHVPMDFVPRQVDLADDTVESLSNTLKERTIKDKREFASLLNTPGAKLDSDLGKIGARYGEKMGRAATQADIARRTVPKDFVALIDPKTKAAYKQMVDDLRKAGDLDSAHVLDQTMNGLPKQGTFMRAVSALNKPFKQSVTAGVIAPNINFTVGNILSNVVQAVQNPEARDVAWKSLKSLPGVIIGSMSDGLTRLGMKPFSESVSRDVLEAARNSDGTRAGMLALIKDPTVKLAVEHGVLDGGFIGAEELAAKAGELAGPKNWKNWLFWTQDLAKGSEQRMRYGMFKDLLDTHTPQEAARIVDETLFSYKYASEANRIARNILPFGQWSFKSIPQTTKFLAEKPAAMAGIRSLYAQNDKDDPLPPWMQGNVNLPLGRGPTGNPEYLTSLRMPFEQLAKLPNPSGDLGDILADTRQDVIGQSSPLIKTAIAAFGGTDPRTGEPYMGNDRAPAALRKLGFAEHSEGARKWNAAVGAGLPGVAQVGATIATLSKLLDDRQSIPVAALNSLTGLKIVDVDEQQAMRQMLQDAIRRDPSIKSSANYFQLEKTPEGQALLRKLQEIRKALRDKKKAASP